MSTTKQLNENSKYEIVNLKSIETKYGTTYIMMDNNIEVDCIVGTSAGALFGPNYFSNQRGRAIRYNKRFCKDRRNISMWSLLFTGNVVNKKLD